MATYRQLFGSYLLELFNVVEISMGLISFWCIYDYLVKNRSVFNYSNKLKKVCQFTFFLYLYHEPIFHIISKLMIKVFGTNSLGYTFAIIVPPFLIIFLGVLFGQSLKNGLPRLYALITGGR